MPTKRCSPKWILIAHALLIGTAGVASLQGLAAQERPEIPPPGEEFHEFQLRDGSEFVAKVVSVDAESVTLETPGGSRLQVALDQIRTVRPAGGRLVNGEFWGEDPNPTRLFFTSTGRSLRKGEGYAGTYLFVFPFVAVGLSDRLTMALGAPILLGTLDPLYLAPKLQVVRTPGTEVSVGTLVFVTGGTDPETVGVAYVVGTFGNSDGALTLGLGFGYSGRDFSSRPVAMLGAEGRLGRRTKVLTENYFLPGGEGLVFSGGFRFMGSKFATDVGAAGILAGEDAGCCVPLLNFSYAFGGGR